MSWVRAELYRTAALRMELMIIMSQLHNITYLMAIIINMSFHKLPASEPLKCCFVILFTKECVPENR